MGNVVCTVQTNQAKTETEQLCVNSSACHICLNIAMCSPLDFLCHTQTHPTHKHIPPSPWQKFLWTFVRTRINSQSVTIDRPSIDFVAHFPPAAHSLCTHQLDWQDVCFTLNQSASVPEQTFGLIRQHLGVIWCQRCAGTKKQLGTCWSNAKYFMLFHLVHIQYWISLFGSHF